MKKLFINLSKRVINVLVVLLNILCLPYLLAFGNNTAKAEVLSLLSNLKRVYTL